MEDLGLDMAWTVCCVFSPRRGCPSEGDRASGLRTHSASVTATQHDRNKSRLSAEIANCYF